MKFNKLYILLAVNLIWFSCSDDDGMVPLPSGVDQVWVLNEGNFLAGNGSIDVFNIADEETVNSVYSAAATIQSAVFFEDAMYLITNAPDRLDILSEDLQEIASITEGLDNPIDFAGIGNQGFISNWGNIATAFSDNPDSYIAVVNLGNNTVVDSVMLDVRPQKLLAFDGKVFIANEGGNSVSVLDPTDLSLEEISLPSGPSDFVLDNQDQIWVLCTSGHLVEIDPQTLTLGSEISGLTTGGFNEKIAIDGTGTVVYFLGGANATFTGQTTVYKVDLSTENVSPFVENGFSLYGIGVNPESNNVYVGDSNAFQSTGTGFRYDENGSLINQFPTGIGPNGFMFQ